LFNLKSYTLVTPPASEPVALADVKTFLRIDGNDDDAILNILIASARRVGEAYTKRAFITQTWRLTMDRFTERENEIPSGFHIAPTPHLVDGSQAIQLSRQPIQTISSIKTTNSANVPSTVLAATYTLDASAGRILLNDGYSWPTALRDNAGIVIEFIAGWANASAVPEPIKQGIIQHVAASYTNKVCADMPEGVKALYDEYRLPEAFGAF
jgi:hypothetical protein